jgi:hypothetical protein
MTPPATAAARQAHRSAPGTRRGAVRHPRRISGPAGPGLAAAVAVPAPGIALPRQRPPRPAAPPRRRPARRRARRPGHEAPGIALRALDAFEAISASALLDRLIRGRVWIGLLAFALIGIVAMQLLVLELNTGIGRTLTRQAQLQRENAQLGIEDSTSTGEARIGPLAAAAGMTFAPSGAAHFVAASPSDVSRAAAALSTAVQAPAGGTAQSTVAAGGEAPAGSGSASQSSATSETSGPSEGGGSSSGSTSPREAGGESGEASAGTAPAQGTSVSSAGQPASSPAPTEASTAGSQATGASAAPPSGTGASGPGGGVQAGPRE